MAQYTLPTTKKYQKPVKESEATEPKKPATLDDLLAQQPEGGYFGQGMRDLADLGYAAQRGIVKGGISVPAVTGEVERLARMGMRNIGIDVAPEPFLYGMEEYQSLIPSLATKAETATGRIAETGLEYGVGAAIPMGLPAKTAKAVGTVGGGIMDFLKRGGLAGMARTPRTPAPAVTTAPTVASEALKTGKLFGGIGTAAGLAGEVGGQTAETATGLGLTGMTILGSLLRRSPASIAKQAIETIDPDDIQRAKDLQRVATEQGIPLSAFETLPSNQLRELADFVARSPEGQGLLDFIAKRKEIIPEQITAKIDEVATESETPMEVVSSAREIAEDYMKQARQDVTSVSSKLYDDAKTETISPALVQNVIDSLKAKKATTSSSVNQEIDSLISRLTNKDGSPKTNVGALHGEFKELREATELKAVDKDSATAKNVATALMDEINMLGNALNTNPRMLAANAIFKREVEQFEAMLNKSSIEALTSKGLTVESAYNSIASPKKARPENIRITWEALNSQDPTVFPDIVGTYMANALDSAQKITLTGDEPMSLGIRFAQTVRGTPRAKENLNAIIEGVADARGVDADQLKTGFNDMLDVLERTNLLPPMGARTQPRGMLKEEIEGGAGLLGFDVTAPTKGVSQMLKDMRRRNAVRRLSEVFTDEDSISALLKLAAEKDNARKSAIVGGIFTTVRETTEPDTGLLADQ